MNPKQDVAFLLSAPIRKLTLDGGFLDSVPTAASTLRELDLRQKLSGLECFLWFWVPCHGSRRCRFDKREVSPHTPFPCNQFCRQANCSTLQELSLAGDLSNCTGSDDDVLFFLRTSTRIKTLKLSKYDFVDSIPDRIVRVSGD